MKTTPWLELVEDNAGSIECYTHLVAEQGVRVKPGQMSIDVQGPTAEKLMKHLAEGQDILIHWVLAHILAGPAAPTYLFPSQGDPSRLSWPFAEFCPSARTAVYESGPDLVVLFRDDTCAYAVLRERNGELTLRVLREEVPGETLATILDRTFAPRVVFDAMSAWF